MHEGAVATRLGLRGLPGVAEDVMVGRDVLLAEHTGGARAHRAPVARRARSSACARQGRGRAGDLRGDARTTSSLTDELAVGDYDTQRQDEPAAALAGPRRLIAGIADGTVDCLATDHAPHHADEKNVEFAEAPFGIVGLETAVSITLDRLVHTGLISLSRMVELMSVNPATILHVPGGSLKAGAPADLTILAPDLPVTVDHATLRSKSKNTPYHGWSFRGGVAATIVGGRVVYRNPAVAMALRETP